MLSTRPDSLERIALSLAAPSTLLAAFEAVVEVAVDELGAPCAAVLERGEAPQALRLAASRGLDPDFAPLAASALESGPDGLAALAIESGAIQPCQDLLAGHPPSPLIPLWAARGIKSLVAVPLAFGPRPLGALILLWDEVHVLSPEERSKMRVLGHLGGAALELAHAREKLDEANRLKNEFVAIASHELRTPMTAIKGYAVLLQEPDLSPQEQADSVRIVGEQTDRLTRILDDLLDLATLESGRMPVKPSAVPIARILDRTRTLMARKYPDRAIEVRVEPPDTECTTDSDRLEQILVNLIDNACKYSAAGGPIRIVAARVGADLDVRVHNDGPGLSEPEQAQLFEKFRRLDRTRHQARGTGLGLFITRQLVELLGGRIGIESGENSGVTVRFRLPDLPRAAP